jgi:ABC-type transporter Mla subunit MlaD
MDDKDTTIQRLKESIENAKQLKGELEQRMAELSNLIQSAETLKETGVRAIEKPDDYNPDRGNVEQ